MINDKKFMATDDDKSLKIDKTKLFNKINHFTKKDGFTNNEITYLKNKILNDKLGLVLNFEETDEKLDKFYVGLCEETKNHIDPSEKNNHLIVEGENYHFLNFLKLIHFNVDVIYIDPPYNTGNKDFTYNDVFINKDDAYKHSKWLSFMKKRLKIAKELLNDNGVIFISIDDNEQAYLKVLCDEIFGESNFVANFVWKKKNSPSGNTTLKAGIDIQTEFILMYAKEIEKMNLNKRFYTQDEYESYKLKDEFYKERGLYKLTPLMHTCTGGAFHYIESLDYLIKAPDGSYFKNHENIKKPKSCCYTWSKKLFEFGNQNGFICIKKVFDKILKKEVWVAYRKVYEKCKIDNKKLCIVYQAQSSSYSNFISNDSINKVTTGTASLELTKILQNKEFPFPKPTNLIKYLISIVNNKNATILDFFAGSGTTGQAVMELNQEDGGNRRFILCTDKGTDKENNIAENVCRERLYRVINGKGSNGQKIDWTYSKNQLYLSNNHIKYLSIKDIDKIKGQYEDINSMSVLCENEFNRQISIKNYYD